MRAHELFEKLAKRPVNEKNKQGPSAKRIAAMGGAMGVGGVGLSAASAAGASNAFTAPLSAEDAALYQRLKGSSTVPVYEKPSVADVINHSFRPGSPAPDAHVPAGVRGVLNQFPDNNAAYLDVEGPLTKRTFGKALGTDKSFVMMGGGLKGNPHILAHELGHAAHDKTMLGKVTQSLPALVARHPLSSVVGAGALGAITGTSEDERVRRAGRWAPLAMTAPMLISEGAATLKGHGNLKRLGASAAQLKQYRKTMLPAFGTYAGMAGLSPAASHLGQSFTRDRAERRARMEEQKVASTIKLSGFGQTLKNLALMDVGGPKGFLQPAARAMEHGKAGTGKLLKPVARVPTKTVRAPGGAYDVSRQAREMGIV